MRKVMALLLAVVMCLAMVACGEREHTVGGLTLPDQWATETQGSTVPAVSEDATVTEDTSIGEETTDTEETTGPEVTTAPEETTVPQETGSGALDGLGQEFKKAMDDYEAFYDEYCDFMKRYNENPYDLTLLLEYGELVAKAKTMDDSFESWDEDEMTDAELKYYLEVNNRVTQKLLDIAG